MEIDMQKSNMEKEEILHLFKSLSEDGGVICLCGVKGAAELDVLDIEIASMRNWCVVI